MASLNSTGKLIVNHLFSDNSKEEIKSLQETIKNNQNLLKGEKAGYRAKLGSAGISPLSGSALAVQDEMDREYNRKNDTEIQEKKLKIKKDKKNYQKNLLKSMGWLK